MGKNKKNKNKNKKFKDVNKIACTDVNRESTDIESWIGPRNNQNTDVKCSTENQASLVLPSTAKSSGMPLPSVKKASRICEKMIKDDCRRAVHVENIEPPPTKISLGNFNSSEMRMKCSYGSQENHVSSHASKCSTFQTSAIKNISHRPIPENDIVVPKSKPCFIEYDRKCNRITSARTRESKCSAMTDRKLETFDLLDDDSFRAFSSVNKSDFAERKSSLSESNYTGAKPKRDIYSLKIQLKNELVVESQKINQININVRVCKSKWGAFYEAYIRWKTIRQHAIAELKNFKKKVHDDQLGYNQVNAALKTINVASRMIRFVPGVTFLAGVATFVTDAACTFTYAAQAINVDEYNAEFEKIMKKDVGIKKILFSALSQSMEKHKDVEDMVKRFHSEISDKTHKNKAKLLEIEDLWLDLKDAYRANDISDTLRQLDQFFTKMITFDDLKKGWESVTDYVNDNPAVLDTCTSGIKAILSAHGMCKKNVSPVKSVCHLGAAMYEQKRLADLVNNENLPQTQLESNIIDAIDILHTELEKINNFVRRIRFSMMDNFLTGNYSEI